MSNLSTPFVRLWLVSFCLLGGFMTLAQENIMYLKDGTELAFKSRNWLQDQVFVRLTDKSKRIIAVQDIDYYLLDGKKYFYAVTEGKVESVSVEADGAVMCYMYVEKLGQVYTYHLYLKSAFEPLTMVHCSGVLKKHHLKVSMSDSFRRFFEPAPQLLNGLVFTKLSMKQKIALVEELNEWVK